MDNGFESGNCFRNAFIVGVVLDLLLLGVTGLMMGEKVFFYVAGVVVVSHVALCICLYFYRGGEFTKDDISFVRFGILAVLFRVFL